MTPIFAMALLPCCFCSQLRRIPYRCARALPFDGRSRLLRAILLLGRVERVRADDVVLVETDEEIPRLGLAEDLVLVVAVGPGLVAVLDADPPGIAEQLLHLVACRLANDDLVDMCYRELPTNRGAPGNESHEQGEGDKQRAGPHPRGGGSQSHRGP